MMSKLLLVLTVAILCGSCKAATTYTVGDNSGWDISSDLSTWPANKKFQVGDVLMFQYSSSDSVNEVTKESYEACNTTNVLKTYSNGNTTVNLDRGGGWYFISGNRLYCLGGMKVAVNVEQDRAVSPAGAPQLPPGGPSGKADDVPSSSTGREWDAPFLCLMATTLFWVLHI